MRAAATILILIALSVSGLRPAMAAGSAATDSYDMSSFAKEIDFALDYTSVTIQEGHDINRKIGNRALGDIDSLEMEKYLREVFEEYIKLYEKKLDLPPSSIKFFKDAYQAINYKVLWSDFKNISKALRVSLKRRGAGFWIAMMCGFANEIIFDLIAWSINPWLLGVTMSIPYNVLWVSGSTIFQRLNMKKRLTKVLGGEKKYKEYIEFRKGLAKKFQRKNFDRYIIPLKTSHGEVTAAVINKRTLWEKLLWKVDSKVNLGWRSLVRKAGLKDGAINYFNVSIFLDANSIHNKYLTSVRKSPLNQKAKVALILNHIFSAMDEETQFKFKDKFSSSFITLHQSSSWKEMRSWTKKMLTYDNWEDINRGFKELPEWVDAREVQGIWKNILLPEYSETVGIGYFKYRKVLSELDEIQAKHFLTKETSWSFELSTRFLAHVQTALRPDKSPACYNDHQKVLRFLIKELN